MFPAMRSLAIKSADGFVLVCAADDPSSLEVSSSFRISSNGHSRRFYYLTSSYKDLISMIRLPIFLLVIAKRSIVSATYPHVCVS